MQWSEWSEWTKWTQIQNKIMRKNVQWSEWTEWTEWSEWTQTQNKIMRKNVQCNGQKGQSGHRMVRITKRQNSK